MYNNRKRYLEDYESYPEQKRSTYNSQRLYDNPPLLSSWMNHTIPMSYQPWRFPLSYQTHLISRSYENPPLIEYDSRQEHVPVYQVYRIPTPNQTLPVSQTDEERNLQVNNLIKTIKEYLDEKDQSDDYVSVSDLMPSEKKIFFDTRDLVTRNIEKVKSGKYIFETHEGQDIDFNRYTNIQRLFYEHKIPRNMKGETKLFFSYKGKCKKVFVPFCKEILC